ncbi:hypothetical protein CM15mP35_05700 [bacterium]|nr:MAG: hypothetical protein CM15mP35_05700 [bacterium]
MRNMFEKMFFEEMKINNDIFLIVGDVGYGVFDEFKMSFMIGI